MGIRQKKYSISKKSTLLQRRLFAVRIGLTLALVTIMASGRFLVDQALTFEASNQSSAVSTVPNPSPLEVPTVVSKESLLQTVEVSRSQQVQEVIDGFIAEHSDGDIAVSVQALDGSFSAGHKQQQAYNSASLYKTLAAYKVLQMVDANELSLSQQTSTEKTIEECIEAAITVSDNPCGIVLQSLAGGSSTDQATLTWGYNETTLSGYYPQTSAYDQNQLFADIYNGNRLSADSRTLLLSYLADQKITNRTPEYGDATLYLKTGDLSSVIHSAGLVESSDLSYTIAVLTDDWDVDLHSKYSAISEIHVQIHEAIKQ